MHGAGFHTSNGIYRLQMPEEGHRNVESEEVNLPHYQKITAHGLHRAHMIFPPNSANPFWRISHALRDQRGNYTMGYKSSEATGTGNSVPLDVEWLPWGTHDDISPMPSVCLPRASEGHGQHKLIDMKQRKADAITFMEGLFESAKGGAGSRPRGLDL